MRGVKSDETQPEKVYVAAGARKEKLRARTYTHPQRAPRTRRYAELRAASAFSFLNGASLPEDLMAHAAAASLPAVALVDVNGVYGAPRFYKAAKEAGVRALVGAEVSLSDDQTPRRDDAPPHPRLTLLVENQRGYRNLCRLITTGAMGKSKGETCVTWRDVEAHAGGLHVLTGGEESVVHRALREGGMDAARDVLARLTHLFPGRVHAELGRHHDRAEEHENRAVIRLAESLRLPLLATNGVRYASPEDKDLYDVLTCIRHHTHVDAAGRKLDAHRERRVKAPAEMTALFGDLPGVLERSADLADRLEFTLKDLGYRFPDFPLPAGDTPASYLRRITWERALTRFRPLTARAQDQIVKELAVIEKLDLAGYFLIVSDIVEFCRRERILVQGRGSAANSAVCYALSITAVDPVKMDLLFERFLSEERGEWPDIDLDLPSGDQREKVIQHVYAKYGTHGAAMTANVITYRDRSASREVAKALGFSPEQVDKLAKRIAGLGFGEYQDPRGELDAALAGEIRAAGFDPDDLRIRHYLRLYRRIQNLPRHLGQHSGGMVIAKGRLDEVVPLEPAAMEGRVVIQWDKDDCADMGIIKIDLLGLGMLCAIEEMIPMIRTHEKVDVDLAHLPQDDPGVYGILNAADTIGLFQVESRAQMASLPRHAPKVFYDIVVQVAIIRPGPIVGGMVHPFFDRRRGRAPVTYAHPSLEPILKRTLGVPLFQEQLLKIAMVAAGFTGGEAEELRRAMGFKRSMEKMGAIEARLRKGMTERGIDEAAQEQIVKSITSFALYGFPESHAASFALIAYASAYLKVHHPAAFYACLLSAWPMGFYHPATIVKDAQRHGTPMLSIDVNRSGWKCRWERDARTGKPGVRLGMTFVKGLKQRTGEAIEAAQAEGVFRSPEELAKRAGVSAKELTLLAHAGALGTCVDGSRGPARSTLTRRAALWQVAEVGRPAGELYESESAAQSIEVFSPLPEMSVVEETLADYATSDMTTGPHLVAHMRPWLRENDVLSAAEVERARDGSFVKAGGAVIVRQRPGTAKGFLFLSIEDETGIFQAIVRPDVWKENRALIVGSPGLIVEGRVQKQDGTLSIKAERFWPMPAPGSESHGSHGQPDPRVTPRERGMRQQPFPEVPRHDFR